MKKLIYILIFFFSTSVVFAQEEGPGAGKLQEKLVAYIQLKLGLGRAEAERFGPVFMDYFKELHRTNKEFKGDRGLEFQRKIIDLRLRYREQFKPIIGEKRSNDVFNYEREFVQKVQEIRQERIEQRQERRADKEKKSELLPN